MDYNFETVNCIICGSDNTYPVSDKGQFNLPANVVLCKECGLGYLNPRWDKNSYLNFYKNEYDKYYRPHIIDKKAGKAVRDNDIIKRFERYNLFPEHVNNILDIGSGEGTNLSDLGEHFHESKLFAIEPSLTAQNNLKGSGIILVSDSIDSSWTEAYKGNFDLIIMRHVAEHFMDPISALSKINGVLSDKGVIYLAVPDSLKPNQNLEKRWFRAVHTYYFNKYSLRNLMSKTGFEIIKLVEGDDFNQGELYLMARKTNNPVSLNISEDHFTIQKEIFNLRLKREGNYFHKVISLTNRIVKKIIK
ncbi:MAG: class I SAM-dependent methyltransferase [Bacteroidota bacterium]